ncbi:predicted protein [Nematostella vectensis]|uniref:RING-type E3 ubiquitin transferase n=1 Tax=Nematostella vectensis TaxID=45351 RepID=A7S5K6_NEMVE|nr:predicted protein [Nematostella vectensis]|eukprot:XP_001633055.1 predicted protein [Nematostella vectensis]
MFACAGQPELVRANQKDVHYSSYLRENIGQVFRNFKGVHSWIKWKKELDVLADVCYFVLTTICGFQTLGEEYCNIVQVDQSKRAIPSTTARAAQVFLHTITPYLLNKLLMRLGSLAQSQEQWPPFASEGLRIWLKDNVPVIQQSILFLHRAHLAVFYLTGVFYHIAKRVTGVSYTLKDSASRPTYRLLGYLSAVQLAVTLLFKVYQKSKDSSVVDQWELSELPRKEEQPSVVPQSMPGTLKCSLCLENVKHITSTSCGHLFCWHCITEWCSSKCPLCREPLQMSRLVYLHHFEPT